MPLRPLRSAQWENVVAQLNQNLRETNAKVDEALRFANNIAIGKVAVTGGNSPKAGQVLQASTGTAAQWTTPVGATRSTITTVLGADTTIVTDTALITQALTMPASGGPFRVFIAWGLYINQSTGSTTAAYVSDGTNTFAPSQTGLSAAGDIGLSGSAVTSVTYANSASVTFTLKASRNNATVTAKVVPLVGAGPSSSLNLTIISS